jgi:hypothetical protein
MDASPRAISPLRQRMIDDMRMRKLCDQTQAGYIRAVRQLAAFLERSPDTATVEDLRRFQLHMVDHGTSPITLNATITGLKFFFDVTLDRGELMAKMQPVRVPRTLAGGVKPRRGRTSDLGGTEPEVSDGTVDRLRRGSSSQRGDRAEGRRHRQPAPDPATEPQLPAVPVAIVQPTFLCPHCGAAMIIIEILTRGQPIRAPPALRVAA